MFKRNNWQAGVKLMRKSGLANTFSAEYLTKLIEAWKQPGAFTGMLNWYRAAVRNAEPIETPTIQVPTLLIWGAQDTALRREMAPKSIALCPEGELIFIPEASHWVQHDASEKVNELLKNFCATHLNSAKRAKPVISK